MKKKYTAHPWHGIHPYNEENILQAFIEIVPTDTVKYEVDKASGYLKLDRPQKFSNIIPALYGFIPKSYCSENIANYCMQKTGRENIIGDGDPLDICVLTEKNISHGHLLVPVRPIGGFRMIDRGEADDKIIAVLENDDVYVWKDVNECPESLINRLKHYFLTYKQMPLHPNEKPVVEITHVYGAKEAQEIIEASFEDYKVHY